MPDLGCASDQTQGLIYGRKIYFQLTSTPVQILFSFSILGQGLVKLLWLTSSLLFGLVRFELEILLP